MKKWEELRKETQNLILHRCTRALYEKIHREEFVAMISMLAMESRMTPEVANYLLEKNHLHPQEMYMNATQVYRSILGAIYRRCGFSAEEAVAKILDEEGVDETPTDIMLKLVCRIAE